MQTYYVTFSSGTQARRGEKILKNLGYPCSLRRTPRWMEARGCGYALWLRCEDIGRIRQILGQERLNHRRIYWQGGDGSLEELGL